MNDDARRMLFLSGMLGVAALLVWSVLGLPRFGAARGSWGETVNHVAAAERKTTDAVAALVYDYRGLDTLGEEAILFTAVTGIALLLRERRGESPRDAPEGGDRERGFRRSEAVRALGPVVVGALVLFGLYVVLHGPLTPGGGFQGGAILGTAPLAVYLTYEYRTFREITTKRGAEILDAAAAASFIAIALLGLVFSARLLSNFIPLGSRGTLFGSGTIWALNMASGLEVAAAFSLLFLEFLEETRQPDSHPGEHSDEEQAP